ncbi:MAG: Crp/Fnr family transcriptional regulator [Ruminococcaceae bacterium]|nr:Crp/Fnr family transcriptional regulator [Oscillospiraceae bacterium]
MEISVSLLRSTPLFHNMQDEEIRQLLTCLRAPVRSFGKGAFLWHEGETVTHCGIVLHGTVDAVHYHDDGTEELIARQRQGDVFGELLMAAQQPSPVSLRCAQAAEVLFLPLEGILGGCEKCCACHTALRRNLLQVTGQKFWQQKRRLSYLCEPSLRGRLLLYLHDVQRESGSDTFTIPYNREELATFLGVNRSAMSRELGRMQREGLLAFYRSSFRLI